MVQIASSVVSSRPASALFSAWILAATKSSMNSREAGQRISLAIRCPIRRNTSLGNAVRRTRTVSNTSKE
jgi:hypothetical protein